MHDELLHLLADLVRIDSVNSSLVDGAAGEAQIVLFIADWARANGLDAELVQETPGRPSVIVRSGMRAPGRTLLLCGHVDTVGVERMSAPFEARIDGDRLYGRGAYDMKAGVAAALVACLEAKRAGLAGEVVVAAVADEEYRSFGVQECLARVHADAAIVTEPTELRLATAHKGFAWAEIEVVGKAAHGSRPHLGIDAIVKAGPILVELGRLQDGLAAARHPLLGPGTVHASMIAGGREEATIPERCLITLERRLLPGESGRDLEEELQRLLARCHASDPQLTAQARIQLERPALETDADEPIVAALAASAADVLGRDEAPVGVSYWADSAFIAAAGIPCVLFGPDGEGAHADVEWVSVPGTLACARALTATAAAFCGGG